MVRDIFFFAMFGLLVIASAFIMVAWGVISKRRAQELKYKGLLRDRYFILCASMTANAFGIGLLFMGRVGATIFDGMPPISSPGIAGMIIATAVIAILVAKTGLVWAVDLHRKGPWWVAFISFSCAWFLFTAWWSFWFN